MSIGYADMTIRDFLMYAPGAWVPVYSTTNKLGAVYRLQYDLQRNADTPSSTLAELVTFTLFKESGVLSPTPDPDPVPWETARTMDVWPDVVTISGATLFSSPELKFHRMPVGYVTNVMGSGLELLVPESNRRSAVKTLSWDGMSRATAVLSDDIEGLDDWPILSGSSATARTCASSIAQTMQMGNVPFMSDLCSRSQATRNTRNATEQWLRHSVKRVCVLSFATALVRSTADPRKAYIVHKQRVLGTITWPHEESLPRIEMADVLSESPSYRTIARGFSVLCRDLFGEFASSQLTNQRYDDEYDASYEE